MQDALTVGFLTWVLAVVLRGVFRPSTSERDAVIGALAGLILLVTIFMPAHGLWRTFPIASALSLRLFLVRHSQE